MHLLPTLFVLSTALAAPAPNPQPPIKIPLPAARGLAPRANGQADYAAVFASANRTLSKYKHGSLPYFPAIAAEQAAQGLLHPGGVGGLLKKRAGTTGTLPLTDNVEAADQLDLDYYGPGSIGTPGKTFQLDFDTGSADLFVPGPSCDPSQCGSGAVVYDPASSSSSKDLGKTASITYGSGSISGEQYSDAVTVAGLSVPSQTFIAVAQASGFGMSGFDGLMGMGFSTIAQTGAPTFFENLITQGTVAKDEFSFYLGRGNSGTAGASELLLGGRNADKSTGETTIVPVTKKGYWQVKIDGAKVSPALLSGPGLLTHGQAAIDTGTTLILAPNLAALDVFAHILGSFPIVMGGGTFWAFPCKDATKYTVSLVFAGVSFDINPLDFNLGTLGSELGVDLGNSTLANILENDFCLSTIMGADLDPTQNLYVVGDSFLKNWYSTYNYNGGAPQVEFAEAV